jgi:hypothetical protein
MCTWYAPAQCVLTWALPQVSSPCTAGHLLASHHLPRLTHPVCPLPATQAVQLTADSQCGDPSAAPGSFVNFLLNLPQGGACFFDAYMPAITAPRSSQMLDATYSVLQVGAGGIQRAAGGATAALCCTMLHASTSSVL